MATRDFKIRTGLVVTGNTEIQGNIILGGNTYTKILDSENIASIINENGISDSDAKAIADLRNDVDSDSAAIQALDTTLNTLSTKVDAIEAGLDSETARIQLLLLSTDSDALSIAGIKQEADSDAATIAELLRQADSDATAIQALNTTLTSDIAAINTRLDSDETQLQAIQTDLETAESNIVTINSNITAINTKLDSDEARLEAIDARVDLLEAAPGISDSDLKVMADLRNDVDSDSIKLQALQIEVAGFGGSTPITVTSFVYTSPANDSEFSGVDDNGLTLSYAPNKIDVYLNGIYLNNTVDYTATTGNSVVLVNAPDSDDILTVKRYLGVENTSNTINVSSFTFTSSANDSDFSGADDNGSTLSYEANKIHVYLNGILLTDTSDYIATNGSTVSLINAPDSDDVLTIIKYLGTVQAGFDSDQVVAIINENTSPDIVARLDSDEIKIQTIQGQVDALVAGTYNDAPVIARLDSDEAQIQAIQTQLDALDTGDIAALRADADSDSIAIQAIRTSVDSDYALFNSKIALFNGLTDSDLTTVSNLRNDVDSDSIAIQAVRNDIDISFNIVNNGASAYTFTGDGFPSGVDNPTLYLERGHTYNFRVNASGHPFEIRQASGGAAYSSGVTNNAAQVGLVRFVVPMDAPDTLAYQCTVHSGMVGVIKIGKAGFDSDQIVGIINANVVTDPTINTRLDSDEIKIQALGTSIESLNTTLTGLSGSAAIQTTVYTFTATQGQTAFTGTDDNGLTLSYAPGYIYVFVNGVLVLDTVDYTATNGTSVNIVQALDSDNTVQVIKHVGTVQAGFDSDQVVAIIGENANIDSTNLDGVGETQQVFDSFATGDYRSVKYFVSASSNDSSWFATEIIVIHDGTNAYLTEYGTISTHDSEFITFDADVSGGNVRLLGTPSNSLTNVKTVRQHISQS
jgi:predicted  nucleic acid-binding Zn-ribbon protein